MLVLNLPFKALMFLTLMRPSLVLFLVLWLKLVKDFLKVRCRRSEERFSRNAETDLVCRLLLEKKSDLVRGIDARTSLAVARTQIGTEPTDDQRNRTCIRQRHFPL